MKLYCSVNSFLLILVDICVVRSFTIPSANLLVDTINAGVEIQNNLQNKPLSTEEITGFLSQYLIISQPAVDSQLAAITPKIQFLIDSPLAKGSRELLNEIEIFLKSEPLSNLKTSDLSIIAKDSIEKALDETGKITLVEFNKILDANPKLRLSSSEYLSDLYSNYVIPKVEDTLVFLDKSPLYTNIKSVAAKPSSEVIGQVSSSIAERLSPVTDTLSGISTRLSTRIVTAASDLSNNLVNSVGNSVESLISEVSTSSGSDGSSSGEVTSFSIPLPSIDLTSVEQTVESVASNSLPAISRATVLFGEGLGRSGDILATNTEGAIKATSSAILDIVTSAASVFPKRTEELILDASETIPIVAEEAVSTVMTPVVTNVLSTIEASQSEVVKTLDNVQNWKFFTDDSHWQTGFWEQQIIKTNDFITNWNEKSFDDVINNINNKLDLAKDNFNKIAKSNPNMIEIDGNDITTKVNSISATLKDMNVKFNTNIAELSVNIGILNNQLNDFIIQTNKVLVESKVLDAVTAEVNTLIKDTSNYVDEFINKNQDL